MRRTVSSNCPCTRRRNPLSWRSSRGTPSLATSSLPQRPSRNPSRPETAHPLEEAMESGDAAAPDEPRWDRRQGRPRRDREPPSGQDVGAWYERHHPEEQAEAEQTRRRRQEARHWFQDDKGERVRERSHGENGGALTGFEPTVQVGGRERRLQAPDDIDRNLEQDRSGKQSGAIHAEERRGGHGHHEGDRPEFAEDPRDAAREGGPDRRDDQESGDRYRDLRVGEAEEPEVQGPVDRHHVQRDTEEDLEADQEGDPFAASDDPKALT